MAIQTEMMVVGGGGGLVVVGGGSWCLYNVISHDV